MNNRKTLYVFEHTSLWVDEYELKQSHFDALVKYNDQHGGKYFKVGHNKLTFTSYVGVIQAGDLVIEVLPKADRRTDVNNTFKWRGVLLTMLANAGYIKLNVTDYATLHTSQMKLLDIYLYSFLEETSQMVHAGLIKRYRRTQGNNTVFKGRLLMDQQVRYNAIHKERFYTEHAVYDKNHACNQVLKKALQIIHDTTFNSSIKQQAASLLLDFEGIKEWQGDEGIWDRITLDRKSLPYQYALDLARMIIFGYCPDFRAGKTAVIALLFDMNILYERYIYRMLKKAEHLFEENQLSVNGQHSMVFWAHKSIRPDIIVSFCKQGDTQVYKTVIDTKWKIVDEGCPSDSDLKQLYVYNMQLGADHAVLLYPAVGQKNMGGVHFNASLRGNFNHSCEMYFGQLFNGDSNELNRHFAHHFLSYLIAGR
jgi:5-methylcytosine-specific restriction enzyme subunit McrC